MAGEDHDQIGRATVLLDGRATDQHRSVFS
jgi:hypothetical protein